MISHIRFGTRSPASRSRDGYLGDRQIHARPRLAEIRNSAKNRLCGCRCDVELKHISPEPRTPMPRIRPELHWLVYALGMLVLAGALGGLPTCAADPSTDAKRNRAEIERKQREI